MGQSGQQFQNSRSNWAFLLRGTWLDISFTPNSNALDVAFDMALALSAGVGVFGLACAPRHGSQGSKEQTKPLATAQKSMEP